MRNFTFFVFLFAILSSQTLIGQAAFQKQSANLKQSAQMDKSTMDGSEFLPLLNNPHPLAIQRLGEEKVIGSTYYDLQTNGSNQNRIIRRGNTISATWTTAEEPTAANRGSGYNHFNGNNWNGIVSNRLEASLRTGWPSLTSTADGDELILCHASPAPFAMHTLQKNSGASSWTEANVTSASPSGLLWPRSANGSGSTIHAIAITTPIGNGGVAYKGVDGQILYYRSPDNGATWDLVDVELPGLDSSNYVSNDADSYVIDANDDIVAIAIFGGFNDVVLYKYTDGGDNFELTTIYDFPLEKYQTDQGYKAGDLPADPNAPDSLAIFASDGSGAVLIDDDGLVHVVFGNMYIADSDLTDGNTSYYPATDGISYWNETYGTDSLRTIVGALDVNGNDTLDVASINNIALYYQSLTTFPSLGIDNDGNIYMAYSGLMENYLNTQDDQHYRHAFMTASLDGGETWAEPVHLGTEDFFPDLPEVMEMVFTTVARHVDDNIHLLMQRDFRPGLSTRGDSDPTEINDIVYLEVPTSLFLGVNTEEVEMVSENGFTIMPNPTTGPVTLDLTKIGKVELLVTDMLGMTVIHVENAQNMYSADLSNLENGVYFFTAFNGTERFTEKVLLNK